jgi:hypothetical protein
MKISTLTLVLLFAAALTLHAGADGKAFTEKYKAAFEKKDTAALESFLYTEGSDPTIVDFYKMMQSAEAGGTVSKIELLDLTPEEAQKAAGAQDSPDGKKVCLPLKPTKKLVIAVTTKDGDSSGTSTSTNFVAEKDGKFVIPVPGPCK